MSLLSLLIALALLALVVVLVSAPLRQRHGHASQPGSAVPSDVGRSAPERSLEAAAGQELLALEAAREAKYREIRDAELDFRTGKLSQEDYAAIDAELRAEAIAILDRLERVQAAGPELRPRDA